MPFISKKKLIEEITQLKNEVIDLKKAVITEELKKLREEKKQYDQQTELLSHIQLKVKDARIINDIENDAVFVRVVYDLPTIVISLDENGKAKKNDFFYSVNALELIDLKDLEKLSKLFEKA